VATLGTATTQEHLNKIFKMTSEVVFCFDGDRAGRQAAWRALENALPLARDGREFKFMFLPDGHDPTPWSRGGGGGLRKAPEDRPAAVRIPGAAPEPQVDLNARRRPGEAQGAWRRPCSRACPRAFIGNCWRIGSPPKFACRRRS
jgi:hypothetical protein